MKEVTVGGGKIVPRSGRHKRELIKLLSWWGHDHQRYDLHVDDGGMEVQLLEKAG